MSKGLSGIVAQGVGQFLICPAHPSTGAPPSKLKQLSEFIHAKPGILHNAAHGECVHWIVSGDRENARSVRHYDMRTLPDDAKSGLLQSRYSA
jgi:hypothetical protein